MRTATWIGGSIIHITAGKVWSSEDGLLWVHAPIAFAFSLLLGEYNHLLGGLTQLQVYEPNQEILLFSIGI